MLPAFELAVAAGVGYLAGIVSAFLLARWAARPRRRS